MDEVTFAAMLLQQNILPLNVHDTPIQTPVASPLSSVVVTESVGFVCLVDFLKKFTHVRATAPRIPMIRQDYIIAGP